MEEERDNLQNETPLGKEDVSIELENTDSFSSTKNFEKKADEPEVTPKKQISDETVEELQTYVAAIEGTLTKIRSLISGTGISMSDLSLDPDHIQKRLNQAPREPEPEDENAKVVEGVFEGEFMIGANGNKYNVPQNYASKSKLVEGDLLKLTIGENGKFIYKQIAPIERDRLVGVLSKDPETGEYYVEVDDDIYRVLLASVTYFKGSPGDEVVILKPKNSKSKWAAVENIVKK